MGVLKNVIPANPVSLYGAGAGIQKCLKLLDPDFRRDDEKAKLWLLSL